jgi:hypothetical protein
LTGAATLAAALALLAPGLAGASRDPASLALAAWPARVIVAAPGRATIHIDNPADEPVVVDASAAGYELDLHGKPRLRPGPAAASWLRVTPSHVAVPARSTVTLSVTAARPRRAWPGDHARVVLLTTRLPSGRKVLARLRIGVVVVIRVPGAVTRRLTLDALGAERRGRHLLIGVALSNRGTLDEWIARSRLTIRLVQGRRLVAALQAQPRRLLARTRGLVEARYSGRARGVVQAVVLLRSPSPGVAVLRRTFRLRL